MRISTIDVFSNAINEFNQQESALVDLQSHISAGTRILTPADDPVGAMRALNFNNDVNQINSFISNVYTAQSALEFEDSTLEAVTFVYQRIRELTVSAGNASLSSTDKDAIAVEINERLGELVSLANSRDVNGNYQFAGFKSKVIPVVENEMGKYSYQGDSGQKAIMLGQSMLVNLNDPGSSLFFEISSKTIQGEGTEGLASFTTAAPLLVTAGTLPKLNVNDLTINNVNIPAAISDNVSTSDPLASAIAMANAINSQYTLHGVRAVANANSVNLGTFTPNGLAAGNFTINGIDVIDATGTEAILIEAITAISSQTGVTVSQPGGPGTAISLVAADGRNIQVQTNGTSTADFSGFSLTGGPLNEVMMSTISYVSHEPFTVGGAVPMHAGIAAGSYNMSLNSGTGTMTTPQVIDNIADVTQTYSIVFNTGGTSYSIYLDSNPSAPLTGFANVPYLPNQPIQFAGISVVISGAPNTGDIFGVSLEVPTTQDVFTTIADFVTGLKGATTFTELSYYIAVALNNLDNAEAALLSTRAGVGSRLNIIDSQYNYQNNLMVVVQQSLSQVQDLDYSEAISLLSAYTFSLQAAQQSFVKIQSLSIFNYL